MGSALAAVRPAARSKVKATVADGAINRARGGQRRSTNVESTEAGTDSEAIRRWVGVDVDRSRGFRTGDVGVFGHARSPADRDI